MQQTSDDDQRRAREPAPADESAERARQRIEAEGLQPRATEVPSRPPRPGEPVNAEAWPGEPGGPLDARAVERQRSAGDSPEGLGSSKRLEPENERGPRTPNPAMVAGPRQSTEEFGSIGGGYGEQAFGVAGRASQQPQTPEQSSRPRDEDDVDEELDRKSAADRTSR